MKSGLIIFFLLNAFILLKVEICVAAFPIKNDFSHHKSNEQKSEYVTSIFPRKTFGNPHTEDKGIFAILSVIFAVTLLFPLAIISGSIGGQNGRKFRILANIGLVIGILVGMVFAGYLLYLFVLS